MPICPNCNEEINYLNFSENKSMFGTYDLNGYEEDGNSDIFAEGTITFSCPECDDELFTNESDAHIFLKSDELKELIDEKIKSIKVKGGKK